jgi:hypothetical protein
MVATFGGRSGERVIACISEDPPPGTWIIIHHPPITNFTAIPRAPGSSEDACALSMRIST